jgi:spore maturation protein CgeB
MKFLFLLEDYNHFYTHCMEQEGRISSKKFEDLITELLGRKYYQGDSLGWALEKSGHQAEYIIPHCYPLQKKWALEKDARLSLNWKYGKVVRSLKARLLNDLESVSRLAQRTLVEQVKRIKPDVLYIHSGVWIDTEILNTLKMYCGKMVLQWSCPISEKWKHFGFKCFDLIVTSSGNILDHFKSAGYPVAFIQQAFDTRILSEEHVGAKPKKGDVVFIGSLSPQHHQKRIEILNELVEKTKIDIFCPPIKEDLETIRNIRSSIKGSLAGMEMFQEYAAHKIALHIPGNDFLEDAGAKRLFEVTGAGTFLLTLKQETLRDYFLEGEEIVTFKDAEDCLNKISYYLKEDLERERVARQGQERTLRDHTFVQRAEMILKILSGPEKTKQQL